MKRRFFILFAITFFFASCSLINLKNEKDNNIVVTVNNNMIEFLKYSFIDPSTNCYINDCFGSPIKDERISPDGTTTVINGEVKPLDKDEIWLRPGSYNIKIVVYKNNTYLNDADKFINEATFYITDDYTINIGTNGIIY